MRVVYNKELLSKILSSRKGGSDNNPAGSQKFYSRSERKTALRSAKDKVVRLNQRLSSAAKTKDMVTARKIFEEIMYPEDKTKSLKPSPHTFATMINVCVRCGNIEEAIAMHDLMERNRMGSVAASTALLKGLCSQARRKESMALFRRIDSTEVNCRTLDTLLRGCLQFGWEAEAVEAFTKYGRAFNASCIANLCRIMCTALRVSDAESLALWLMGMNAALDPTFSFSEVMCCLSICQAYVVLRDRELAALWLVRTRESIDKTSSACQSESLGRFADHRMCEVQHEVSRLQDVVNQMDSLRTLSIEDFNRFFYFAPDDEVLDVSSICEYRECLGLFRTTADVNSSLTQNTENLESGSPNLSKFFSISPGPVKIEVASGSGEWVVDKARGNEPWLAMELRFDRCADIWRRASMEKDCLPNLAIIGGDARQIMKKILPPNIADEVHVNFPEPPLWKHEELKAGQGGDHLLNEEFLGMDGVWKVLQVNGVLNIVSDNEEYLYSVASTLNKMEHWGNSNHMVTTLLSHEKEDYKSKSYFDRMWQRGNKNQRFVLRAEKK